jgi:hypothetical protein
MKGNCNFNDCGTDRIKLSRYYLHSDVNNLYVRSSLELLLSLSGTMLKC